MPRRSLPPGESGRPHIRDRLLTAAAALLLAGLLVGGRGIGRRTSGAPLAGRTDRRPR